LRRGGFWGVRPVGLHDGIDGGGSLVLLLVLAAYVELVRLDMVVDFCG
jgi:hypothetical protein